MLLLMIFGATAPSTANDLTFDEAVAAYLADDDEIALPALARLAAEGDRNAQLLLGSLTRRPLSPWVASLPRRERYRMLRAPGGLSGKSWWTVAASEGDPLATALNDVKRPPYSSEEVGYLLEEGEIAAATRAVIHYLSREPMEGLMALLDHPNATPDLKYLIMHTQEGWPSLPRPDKADLDEALGRATLARALYDLFGDKQRFGRGDGSPVMSQEEASVFNRLGGLLSRIQIGDWEPTAALLDDAAETSSTAALVKTYCLRACPDAVRACMADTVTMVGGYFILWELVSPIQSVIPDEVYLSSPRMSADIARTMQARLGLWPAELVADITSRSCAAASRFRTRFD